MAISATVWWALRPVAAPEVPSASAALREAKPLQASAPDVDRIDPSKFEVALWREPDVPVDAPPPEQRAPSPPPMRLVLLAISTVGDEREVVFYDPDTDKVLVAREGDMIAGREVQQVAPDHVALKDDTGTVTLALREDRR